MHPARSVARRVKYSPVTPGIFAESWNVSGVRTSAMR
jgi:hypothetical protein